MLSHGANQPNPTTAKETVRTIMLDQRLAISRRGVNGYHGDFKTTVKNDISCLIIKRCILPWFLSPTLNLQIIIIIMIKINFLPHGVSPITSLFERYIYCHYWCTTVKCLGAIVDIDIAITNWYICLVSTAKHNTQTGRPLPSWLPVTIQDYVFKSAFYLLPWYLMKVIYSLTFLTVICDSCNI